MVLVNLGGHFHETDRREGLEVHHETAIAIATVTGIGPENENDLGALPWHLIVTFLEDLLVVVEDRVVASASDAIDQGAETTGGVGNEVARRLAARLPGDYPLGDSHPDEVLSAVVHPWGAPQHGEKTGTVLGPPSETGPSIDEMIGKSCLKLHPGHMLTNSQETIEIAIWAGSASFPRPISSKISRAPWQLPPSIS